MAREGMPGRSVGLGLRPVHYGHVLDRRPAVSWFEVISENYLGLRGGQGGGRPLEHLEAIRKDYPLALHGVSLNLGSADPLDQGYLKKLKALIARIEPCAVSDHLCWTGVDGRNVHDLLPLPYDDEVIGHVASRIRKVQDFIGRRMLVENVSSYISYRHSAMPEWEFLSQVTERAGCGILLDVNNIHVSAANHGFSGLDYLAGVPSRLVEEMHLAGYSEHGGLLIDTHDHPVSRTVWELYRAAVRRFGAVPTLIEWDDRIPSFTRLEREAALAQEVRADALGAACA